jgi:hypothetical protein
VHACLLLQLLRHVALLTAQKRSRHPGRSLCSLRCDSSRGCLYGKPNTEGLDGLPSPPTTPPAVDKACQCLKNTVMSKPSHRGTVSSPGSATPTGNSLAIANAICTACFDQWMSGSRNLHLIGSSLTDSAFTHEPSAARPRCAGTF